MVRFQSTVVFCSLSLAFLFSVPGAFAASIPSVLPPPTYCAFGDSIAKGLIDEQHIPGKAVVGLSPNSIVNLIQESIGSYPLCSKAILSSGASNNDDPKVIEKYVPQQIKILQAAKKEVILLGVGTDYPESVNQQLAQIATRHNAVFSRLPSGTKVHPSYGALIKSVTNSAFSAPLSLPPDSTASPAGFDLVNISSGDITGDGVQSRTPTSNTIPNKTLGKSGEKESEFGGLGDIFSKLSSLFTGGGNKKSTEGNDTQTSNDGYQSPLPSTASYINPQNQQLGFSNLTRGDGSGDKTKTPAYSGFSNQPNVAKQPSTLQAWLESIGSILSFI